MFIAFALEGVGICALAKLGTDPVLFVILSGMVFFAWGEIYHAAQDHEQDRDGMVFFAWGEIYSLFPSTITDTFGAKFATTNTGLMYTAKGTAAIPVPYGTVL